MRFHKLILKEWTAIRLWSTNPTFFALTRNLDIVCTVNPALLARGLTLIQMPEGISLIALSALLMLVGLVMATLLSLHMQCGL
jgi:hypothetical protein